MENLRVGQREHQRLRGCPALLERQIDNLIEAGWHVLDSGFDEAAFQNWRREALKCLTVMLGSEHAYTQYFKGYVHHPQRAQLLAVEGILSAAKEEMTNSVD